MLKWWIHGDEGRQEAPDAAGYKSDTAPSPPCGTWGKPRYRRESSLWAQQAFSRPFERGDLRWRQVRLGPSVGCESFQRLRSLGSPRLTGVRLHLCAPLCRSLCHSHTSSPLCSRWLVFYLLFLPLEPFLRWIPNFIYQSHNLLWWLCEVHVLLGLFEVSAWSISWFPHHMTLQAYFTTLTVWVIKPTGLRKWQISWPFFWLVSLSFYRTSCRKVGIKYSERPTWHLKLFVILFFSIQQSKTYKVCFFYSIIKDVAFLIKNDL